MQTVLSEYGRFLIASLAAVIVVMLIPVMREGYRNYSVGLIALITGAKVDYVDDTALVYDVGANGEVAINEIEDADGVKHNWGAVQSGTGIPEKKIPMTYEEATGKLSPDAAQPGDDVNTGRDNGKTPGGGSP